VTAQILPDSLRGIVTAQILPDRFPVVLFTNSFIMGGMEEHLLLLGRALLRRAFPVAAICSPAEEIRPLRDGLAKAGVFVHALEHRDSGRLGILQRFCALVDTLRRYPGCVVHIHSTGFHNGDLLTLSARLAGVRAVVRTEHVPPQPPITASNKLRVRLRDHFVDRVICVSEQNRVEHIGRLGRDAAKFQVVLNGCDLARFSPKVDGTGVHVDFGLDPSAPLIGVVARLGEERKGIGFFLEMARAVATVRPDARFLIVGDGPLRPELEQRAQHLGLADSVIFAGERQDVPRLVAAMTVFVMPSLYEGCQYTLMEAMAMAKPIVSTPAGVAPDVIQDGVTGRMVPFADGEALALGVLDLLDDDDRATRMGTAAREVALDRFSVDGMVDNLVRVYCAA
jgi:glycosyltransferase involved in cell wall biosynthesis